MTLRQFIKNLPVIGPIARWGYSKLWREIPFSDSASYWERRYIVGGNSGSGSYNNLAEFKAEIINAFVEEHQVESVIEFGCGDGNQLVLANYLVYVGFDVSPKSIAMCRQKFLGDPSKSFKLVSAFAGDKADLSLSLDVIYHLVEDSVFDSYMYRLFESSRRYVIIYSSNKDSMSTGADHVRHRKFTDWVERQKMDWELIKHIPNRYPYNGDSRSTSFADFYVYQHKDIKAQA